MKNKKILYFIFCVFCVLIVALTVVYAALSTTLKITGTGNVVASNWDIKISNYSSPSKTGSASFTTPTISGTTIANYTVGLTKPGDSVRFVFKISNDGNLNAELASIVNNTPICTSATGNTNDAKLVCDNLDISFKYTNGHAVSSGDIFTPEKGVCFSGNTNAQDDPFVEFIISLKNSMTSVPSSKVTISNLSQEFLFSQTDKPCSGSCFVAGTKVLSVDGYINIEDIEVGDYVYSINESTKEKELKEVVKRITNMTNVIYKLTIGNNVVETTYNHPFYVLGKGWIEASKIVVGDIIFSDVFSNTMVSSIDIINYEKNVDIYNIEVEDNHNYLITNNDLLVHNATDCLG